MALAVTGAGGLAMIGGMLILGNIAGSYNLTDILQAGDQIRASEWYLPALILILLGAFTKSAQFPFHFWLPHAMAAPTPVSAYLHSATMVKAGVFLMARMWPVLAGTDAWFYIVATTGLVTMVLGALIALFKDDLKALLAFSTVSHLGLLTMLLGFGTQAAAVAAVFHIINHLTFKAALFMTAGIVDHETHTRDIKRLGGLRHLMPITFLIGTVAALSMAGIPLFNGFLSKEMMLEEASHTDWFGSTTPCRSSPRSARFCRWPIRSASCPHVFLGPVRDDYPHKPHDPPFGMWAAPALLAVLVIVIGVAPFLAEGIVTAAANAVTGAELHPHLKIWHGVTPALWMSVIADRRRRGPAPAARAARQGMDRGAEAGGQGDLRPARRRAGRDEPGDHRDHPQRRHQPLPRDLHRHGAGAGLDRLVRAAACRPRRANCCRWRR
jgi:multicomponent K+:H+ antiporter subunit A